MKFKKVLALLLVSSIVLILSACGKADNKKEVTMGEMFHSKDEKVYFEIFKEREGNETLNKDNIVERVVVTKNGKLTSYNVGEAETTLADLEKKSNDDIVKIAKKANKKAFDEYLTPPEDQEFDYIKPKPRKAKINAETDDSGNHTQEEGIFIQTPIDVQVSEDIKHPDEKDLNHTYNSFGQLIQPTEIKGSKFAGLENDKRFFVTKVGDKVEKIKFDEPDSKYVNVVDGKKKDK